MEAARIRRGNRVRNIMMKFKTQNQLQYIVDLFLTEWSDFQKELIRIRDIRKLQYIDDVFDFFATTFANTSSEPKVEDLVKLLATSMLKRFYGLVVPGYKVVEELLTTYHEFRAKEYSDEACGDKVNTKWLSIESQSTIKQRIDKILSEWEVFKWMSNQYLPLR